MTNLNNEPHWNDVSSNDPHKRLTESKAEHICKRDGMQVCGYVMISEETGQMCVVSKAAVRWIDSDEFFNFMHDKSTA